MIDRSGNFGQGSIVLKNGRSQRGFSLHGRSKPAAFENVSATNSDLKWGPPSPVRLRLRHARTLAQADRHRNGRACGLVCAADCVARASALRHRRRIGAGFIAPRRLAGRRRHRREAARKAWKEDPASLEPLRTTGVAVCQGRCHLWRERSAAEHVGFSTHSSSTVIYLRGCRWPRASNWFVLTFGIFILQAIPLIGIFIMFLGAPFWPIFTINLGFAHLDHRTGDAEHIAAVVAGGACLVRRLRRGIHPWAHRARSPLCGDRDGEFPPVLCRSIRARNRSSSSGNSYDAPSAERLLTTYPLPVVYEERFGRRRCSQAGLDARWPSALHGRALRSPGALRQHHGRRAPESRRHAALQDTFSGTPLLLLRRDRSARTARRSASVQPGKIAHGRRRRPRRQDHSHVEAAESARVASVKARPTNISRCRSSAASSTAEAPAGIARSSF